MLNPRPSCPRCGRIFPASSLGALCPACLMEGLWEGDAPDMEGLLLAVPGYEVRQELGRGVSPDEKWARLFLRVMWIRRRWLQVIGLGEGEVVAEWPCDPGSRGFPLWLPDGGFLYAGKLTACLRADAGRANLRPFPDAGRAAEVLPLALHPDGTRVVVAWKTAKALSVLTLPGGVEEWRTPVRNLPGPVAWSADGRLLAVGEQVAATRLDCAEPGAMLNALSG